MPILDNSCEFAVLQTLWGQPLLIAVIYQVTLPTRSSPQDHRSPPLLKQGCVKWLCETQIWPCLLYSCSAASMISLSRFTCNRNIEQGFKTPMVMAASGATIVIYHCDNPHV